METEYEVIIIGGSYAGLSAAMALGRSLRKTLVIDSGKPCNSQTPQSHNFITHDGKPPAEISNIAKEQVLQYPTVTFYNGLATHAAPLPNGYEVGTAAGDSFTAKKLLFATGVADQMHNIPGFANCWGISALHCPYCHGYEIRNKTIGVMANGDLAFELCKLHSNWTKNLVLFTNGKSTLNKGQTDALLTHNITIIEAELSAIAHTNGYIHHIELADGNTQKVDALYSKITFKQHCELPEQLGCGLDEHGYIAVDALHKTTVNGIYAAGDNTTIFRSVASAIASGNRAGAFINKELIDEAWV